MANDLPPLRAWIAYEESGRIPQATWDLLQSKPPARIDVVQHPDRAVSFGPDTSVEHPKPGPLPVTDEMIAAGAREIAIFCAAPISDGYWAGRVYRAMHAAAPVELIGDGERIWHTRALIAEGRVAELEGERGATLAASRERDAWTETARHFANGSVYYQGLLDKIGGMFGVVAKTCDDGTVQDGVLRAKLPELVAALLSHADAQKELLALSRATIATRDARIAELDTMLAQRPAPVVPDSPTPPILNAIRPRVVDQRRIGG